MNCKYCGTGLPSKGGACPGCGRMIPFDQQKMMKAMLDPRLNEYHNKDTSMYKKESAYENFSLGKALIIFGGIILIIILLIMFI